MTRGRAIAAQPLKSNVCGLGIRWHAQQANEQTRAADNVIDLRGKLCCFDTV